MFKHEEHKEMAQKLGDMLRGMAELSEMVLKAYGKSSSSFKSCVVAEKRIDRVIDRLEILYEDERKKFIEQIPQGLWDQFPTKIYRKSLPCLPDENSDTQ